MAFSGVPEKEMPFLRNHARHAFPPRFWHEDDPLVRQGKLFELLAEYARFVRKGSAQRADELEKGIAFAREQWERAARRLRAQQVRRLPKMPNTREQGAVPEDDPLPNPREARASRTRDEREMIKKAHDHERPTEGEERWNPKWGDPNEELPPVLPQGMRALPQSEEVPIPERDGRPRAQGNQGRRATGQAGPGGRPPAPQHQGARRKA